MSRLFTGIIFCMLPFIAAAQVTLSVQLPPAGLVQKEQLWNLLVANNSKNSLNINIMLNLREASTGQLVLSAGTGNILLGKGSKLLNNNDVQPVQYNSVSGTPTSNYLPLGSYIACYTVSLDYMKDPEVIAEECVRVNIIPLSPPLLNTPANKSIISGTLPQFTWMPPTPSAMFDDLNYDLVMTEVMDGQSPGEAILYNTPVYSKSNSRIAFESYPASYSELEPGKIYAWQVIARNGLNYSAATEVWSFSITKDSVTTTTTSGSYIPLTDNPDEAGIHYISGDNVQVKYYAFDAGRVTTVRFVDRKRTVLQESKQSLTYGDNFLSFRLNNRYQKGQLYFIELTDSRGKIHTASFIIK